MFLITLKVKLARYFLRQFFSRSRLGDDLPNGLALNKKLTIKQN